MSENTNEMFDIRSARTRAGLTQEQISDELGMAKKTYIEYEKGHRIFRVNTAWEFSKIVKIPFDKIIFFKINYTSSVVST